MEDQRHEQEQQPETGAQDAQNAPQTQQPELPQTQAELDALIEKRLARERKKLAKQTPPASAAQPDAQTPPPAADPAANAAMQRELTTVRAQLEAVRGGVRSDLAEDAVLLALHEVEKAGDEPDEDSIREALKTVLKRHPDWKQEKTGGIKVGAQQGKPAEQAPGAALGVTIF